MTSRAPGSTYRKASIEKVHAFERLEPPRVERVVGELPFAIPAREVRRRIERLRGNVVVAREARGDVLRNRKDTARLPEGLRVHTQDGLSNLLLLGIVGETAVRGSVEVVDLAVLMKEPGHLERMLHEIRRELRRDHHVDRNPIRLRDLEKAPDQGLFHDVLNRIPFEGDVHHVDQEPAGLQRGGELRRQDLGPADDEGRLHRADADAAARHGSATSSPSRVL